MLRILAQMIADIVLKSALSAAGASSDWEVYQPKEPASLRKLLK